MALKIVLAVCGAFLIAAGAALVYVPLGLTVAGLELIAAAYVWRYLEATRETPRPPR